MEAIVLGVKNGRAALLLEDGTTAYRRMECKPGQRVEVPADVGAMPSAARTARAAAVAAAFAVVVSGGTLYETAMPVSYVTEDVNPSLEYSLNRMDRVIGVSALNEDAEAIVENLGVSGGTIQTAVGAAGERLEAAGKLDDDGFILFSVASDSDQRAKKLENALSDVMSGREEDNGMTFSVLRVSEDEHRAAKKLDMSAGRYKEMVDAKGKSAASDRQLVSEFQRKSVREMLDGEAEEKNADAVQSADGQESVERVVEKSKKKNKEVENNATEVKQAAENEEKPATKQVQPASQPSAPAQSKPVNPPAGNPQPAAPAQQPQPQQDNGGNDAPTVESQPGEAPQEVNPEEKKKDNAGKAETKKEESEKADVKMDGSGKEDKGNGAEPPSDDFGADGGPAGGGEPGGGTSGGGPGGPP